MASRSVLRLLTPVTVQGPLSTPASVWHPSFKLERPWEGKQRPPYVGARLTHCPARSGSTTCTGRLRGAPLQNCSPSQCPPAPGPLNKQPQGALAWHRPGGATSPPGPQSVLCLLGPSTWGMHTWSWGSWPCGRLHHCGPLVPEHSHRAAPLPISPEPKVVWAKPRPSLQPPPVLPACPPQITQARGSDGGSCRAFARRALYRDPSLPSLSLPTHLPLPLGPPHPPAEGKISLHPSSQRGSFRFRLHWRPGVHPYLPGSSGYRSRGQTGVCVAAPGRPALKGGQ